MNYENYVKSLVEGKNVGLVGWPEDVDFKRMSKQSAIGPLRILRDALKCGTCKWKVLTAGEKSRLLAQFKEMVKKGEVTEKVRKVKEKGGGRVTRTRAKKAPLQPDSDSDEGEDDEGEDSEEDASRPRKAVIDMTVQERRERLLKLARSVRRSKAESAPAKKATKRARGGQGDEGEDARNKKRKGDNDDGTRAKKKRKGDDNDDARAKKKRKDNEVDDTRATKKRKGNDDAGTRAPRTKSKAPSKGKSSKAPATAASASKPASASAPTRRPQPRPLVRNVVTTPATGASVPPVGTANPAVTDTTAPNAAEAEAASAPVASLTASRANVIRGKRGRPPGIR